MLIPLSQLFAAYAREGYEMQELSVDGHRVTFSKGDDRLIHDTSDDGDLEVAFVLQDVRTAGVIGAISDKELASKLQAHLSEILFTVPDGKKKK